MAWARGNHRDFGGLLAGIHGTFNGQYCGLVRRVTCGYPWPGLGETTGTLGVCMFAFHDVDMNCLHFNVRRLLDFDDVLGIFMTLLVYTLYFMHVLVSRYRRQCVVMIPFIVTPRVFALARCDNCKKKARILELKRIHLKIIALTSYASYPSRKIQHIRSCTSQETTKIQDQNDVSRRTPYAIQFKVINYCGRCRTWSLLQETPDTPYPSMSIHRINQISDPINRNLKTGAAFRLRPYHFTYPERKLTMKEMLYKFIVEEKKEHEEMRAFINEFRATNELLFKERNNLLSELKFEVHELLRVIDNALISNYKVKRITTRGGKTTTQDIQNDNTNIHTEEPLVELLANDKSDSFFLKGLEKSINQSDLASCESLGNKSDDDSNLEKPIWCIDSFNTLYSVAQETARPDGVESEHLYSASTNEIDEKKPELKNFPHHLEYAYLHDDKSFPIIFSSDLSEKEKMLFL
nr:hypothetical protein [Tanacetum cinerariifolium]